MLTKSVDPALPKEFKKPGLRVKVLTKVCVGVTGAVRSVTFLQRSETAIDEAVERALLARCYKPLVKDGTPVPFCHPVSVQFTVSAVSPDSSLL